MSASISDRIGIGIGRRMSTRWTLTSALDVLFAWSRKPSGSSPLAPYASLTSASGLSANTANGLRVCVFLAGAAFLAATSLSLSVRLVVVLVLAFSARRRALERVRDAGESGAAFSLSVGERARLTLAPRALVATLPLPFSSVVDEEERGLGCSALSGLDDLGCGALRGLDGSVVLERFGAESSKTSIWERVLERFEEEDATGTEDTARRGLLGPCSSALSALARADGNPLGLVGAGSMGVSARRELRSLRSMRSLDSWDVTAGAEDGPARGGVSAYIAKMAPFFLVTGIVMDLGAGGVGLVLLDRSRGKAAMDKSMAENGRVFVSSTRG